MSDMAPQKGFSVYLRCSDVRNTSIIKCFCSNHPTFFESTPALCKELGMKVFVFKYCCSYCVCERRRPVESTIDLLKRVSMTHQFDLRQWTDSCCQIRVLRYQASKSQTSRGKVLKSWSASMALCLNIKQTFENPYKTWTRLLSAPMRSTESADVKPGCDLSVW